MHGGEHEEPNGVDEEPEAQGAGLAQASDGGMYQRRLHGCQQQADADEEARSRAEVEPQPGMPKQRKRHFEGAEGDEGHEGDYQQPRNAARRRCRFVVVEHDHFVLQAGLRRPRRRGGDTRPSPVGLG